MDIRNHRQQSVNVHQFAMVPKPDIPRSSFLRQQTHKTTFDENWLVPIFVDEVLPGDTFALSLTAFARMATPIFPVMDNMYLDTFFFFVPARLLWTNWVKFMGEQVNPADSISFTVPVTNAGQYAIGSLGDYFGLGTVGQYPSVPQVHNNLPLRAYNLIWNQWFRDENLQNSVVVDQGDGPDNVANYVLLKRGKRHDYFTSALPWTQKGNNAITIPLAGTAPVIGIGIQNSNVGPFTTGPLAFRETNTGVGTRNYATYAVGSQITTSFGVETTSALAGANPKIFADLTQATGATINQLRQSFQIQRLLERDARGGTRYTELIRAHFGCVNPDFRLQRSEYLGGGSQSINVSPIPQTAQTGLTGGTTPLGTLGGYGTVLTKGNGFVQSFTEHGYIIGLANIRADQTYQQGIRRMWWRSTRYDFYFPAFANLGEQAVQNREIYADGSGNDVLTFGFQERWAEMRYLPSMVTGLFRSTAATPLDAWHLAEKFTVLPTLSSSFITANAPVGRVVAVNTANTHFIFDGFFNVKTTRAMPLYSVPGMIDHF